jgi:hypothetical protein
MTTFKNNDRVNVNTEKGKQVAKVIRDNGDTVEVQLVYNGVLKILSYKKEKVTKV